MITAIFLLLIVCILGFFLLRLIPDSYPGRRLIFVLFVVCATVIWYWRPSFGSSVSSITVHEWMIDSISGNGKLTYRLNRERFDREQAEIHGYSFHSDGGLNSIQAHLGGGGQSPIGTHRFGKKLLMLAIDGKGVVFYRFKRTSDQLILSNDERTIWLSPYSDWYMHGFNRKDILAGNSPEK